MEHRSDGRFVGISLYELLAIRLRLIGGKLDLRRLSVFKEEEHITRIVRGHDHIDRRLALVHAERARHIIAECARLCLLEVVDASLVDLAAVREEEKLFRVIRNHGLGELVAVFELLLAAHAQGLRGYLLEIALLREEERHGIIGYLLLLFLILDVGGIDNLRSSRLAVFLYDILKLVYNYLAHSAALCEDILKVGNELFELLNVLGAL